mmetsp:Transcript_24301/g.38937  ORF Transcript_24301/g.38937 Transcript_24301/m.38937 type:complete len:650 (+) Transcript_24301:129-2078(+)
MASGESQGAAMEPDSGVFFVSMSYKGTAIPVPVQDEDPLASIFDFVQEALDFPRENCKLIFRGKMLRPDNDSLTVGEAGLKSGAKVMLVASSAADIAYVQSSRADPLVKGFVEEERDEQSRRKRAKAAGASAWGTKQDPEFKFNSIKAEFKYSSPSPYEAERLLQKLATDPGIIEMMKTRSFKVGILTEMSPDEAKRRMEQRGQPDMDLLGYNMNAGDMIVLKLRTDNTKGFRPYSDLINTLIHECTHNVWGPHDHNFWKLFGEMKAQYMKFHRFWSHGGKASDSNSAGQFQGFVGDEGSVESQAGSFGNTLGGTGGVAMSEAERRAMRAAAAEARGVSEVSEGADASDNPVGAVLSDNFVPNFLASNGTWMFQCPCGLVHEVPDDFKPVQGEAGGTACAVALAQAALAALINGTAAPASLSASPGVASAAAEPETEQQQEDEPMQEQKEQPEQLEQLEQEGLDEPMQEQEQKAEEMQVDTALAGLSIAANLVAAASDRQSEAATPSSSSSALPLDMDELAAQGLDGASLWLQRFSSQLSALCRPDNSVAKAAAVQLLLKLVRNVVESPQDPKFRRIKADNPKVRATLIEAGGEAAQALMALLGFEVVTENGERAFVLRDATFDCARLHMGKELLEQELSGGGGVAAAR